MIRNKKQLAIAREQMKRFKERLRRLSGNGCPNRARELEAAGIRRVMLDLGDQIKLFEDALDGRVNRRLIDKLLSSEIQSGRPRFGTAIFALRTAGRMTQAELARRLGTHQEAIARWEREDYAEYSYAALQRVFEALGYRLTIAVQAMAG